MKKIVAAWIEQIFEFDSEQEYMSYLNELAQKGQKFKEVQHEKLESGVVRIGIRKQYNKNKFPESEKILSE